MAFSKAFFFRKLRVRPPVVFVNRLERSGWCSRILKPKTAEDLKPEAERIKIKKCALCPPPDDTPVSPDLGPGGLMYGIGGLMRLRQPDLSSLFAKTTGGRTLSFLKKNALEQAIQLVGEEVHRQYLLSFEPKGGEPGKFHANRVAVKNRPELQAKTRDGYWALQ